MSDDNGEIFSPQRMARAVRIANAIMDNWQRTNSYRPVVRVTEAVAGLILDDLRKCYFTVGVEGDLTDLPFIDTLVVFETIRQLNLGRKEQGQLAKAKGEHTFKVEAKVKTYWSDEEAVPLLNAMRIETPFDPGTGFLHLAPAKR